MRFFALLAAFVLLSSSASIADSTPRAQGFVTHAAFFSLESKHANLLDPHAFVADSAAPSGVGPQGIMHVAGVRPAFGADDPQSRVLNGQGKPLGFTLGQWFGARGRVVLSAQTAAGTTMDYALTGLISSGVYSFFENHFSSTGVTFTPLDGSGAHNTFTATLNGTADGTIDIPGPVTRSDGLLLVYQSDSIAHGAERGQIGMTAHHQLIIRVAQ